MRLHASIMGLALALAAGCTHQPRAELAGYDGLERQIRDSYRKVAMERHGLCIRPEIGIITRAQIINDNQDELVVAIRHTVRGDEEDGDDILDFRGGCPAFGSRTFRFAKSDNGLVFQTMTGPNRPEVNYNFNNPRAD